MCHEIVVVLVGVGSAERNPPNDVARACGVHAGDRAIQTWGHVKVHGLVLMAQTGTRREYLRRCGRSRDRLARPVLVIQDPVQAPRL